MPTQRQVNAAACGGLRRPGSAARASAADGFDCLRGELLHADPPRVQRRRHRQQRSVVRRGSVPHNARRLELGPPCQWCCLDRRALEPA